MASEIRRVCDGTVAGWGSNAIRDGDRYLVRLELASSKHQLDESDIGGIFEVQDGALFLFHGARMELLALPAGELDLVEFRPLVSPEEDSLTHHSA